MRAETQSICFSLSFLLSKKVLSVGLKGMQDHISHPLSASACLKFPHLDNKGWISAFIWPKPLQVIFTPPGWKKKIFYGGKITCYRNVCLPMLSAIPVLSLQLFFLHHPPFLMFIKFSSQERPVLQSFHVLHFCVPGGGSILQTCRWCSPFYKREWEGRDQAGLTHSEAAFIGSLLLKSKK